MTDDKRDLPPRREAPLAAAARRMAEEQGRRAAANAARPASPVEPERPQPADSQPAPAATWAAAGWPPPAPETRQPQPSAYDRYPPPPAAAVAQGGSAYAAPGEPSYSAWWKRVVAALIDGVVVFIPAGILFAVMGAGTVQTDPATGQATFHPSGAYFVAWLIALVGSLVYYTVLEGGPGGATVGKLAMGIQVRSESGMAPIGYGKALGRRLMASVFWWLLLIPGLLDVLSPLWDARRQTWHDKVVGSVVVDKA